MFDTIWKDVRYAARTLLKSPGFTLVALVALALGIGANTAIFSVVNAVLLRTLPYRDSDRLVAIWEMSRTGGGRRNVVAPRNFLEWQSQAQSFESMAIFYDARINLTGAGDPVEIPAQVTTANLFSLLGAEAALGRTFTEGEGEPGRGSVIVLSHGFWQRQFGGAPDIVNKTVSLNGAPATVIGVMPPDFKFFIKENSRGGKPAEMWIPVKFQPGQGGRYVQSLGRLKPGVTLAQARAEMDAIAGRLEQANKEFNTNMGIALVPLREQLAGELRQPLLILLGAVAFVLLIACANVANLLLARSAARSKEIAIRVALGAGRGRIVRQLLTESLLLAFAGGVLGLLLAMWGVEALVALSPPNLIGAGEVGVSLPVLAFTFGVSLLTGVIFGLVPAVEASRFDANGALKETARGSTGGPRARRVRNAFVAAEVALSLVLLVGAGLMIKSFARLRAVDPGFNPDNLLTMSVGLPVSKYPDDARVVAFFRETVARVSTLPGVRSAAAVNYLPFYSGLGARTSFFIEGEPRPAPGQEPSTDVRVTDENYFRTLGIPVLRGRTFTPQEAAEVRPVVVVNESLARKYFTNEDPIGKRIRIEMVDDPPPLEIIGVVGDARYQKLDAELYPMVYQTPPQLTYNTMTLVVRTENDPLSLAAAARREVQAMDADQPVADVRTMASWIGESTSRARFGTLLLSVFAAVALVLAAVGVYGVMSYSVAQRTQEIGIRMALGARPRDILRLVIKGGMLVTLAGVAVGAAAAYALSRVMTGLLFEVQATDPVVFVSIPVLLACVAALACYLPARRASKVDPMIALRYE